MENRARSLNGESIAPENKEYAKIAARATKYVERLNLKHFHEYASILEKAKGKEEGGGVVGGGGEGGGEEGMST